MKLTNKYNLPQPLVNALERRQYSMGDADISVTQVIEAPRVRLLKRTYRDHIEQDVSEAVWMLLGSAIHHVLELGGDSEHLTEERLFLKVGDWIVSGAIDVQKVGEDSDGNPVVDIIDYKFTSVWSVIIAADQETDKIDWSNQLNMYGLLVEACTNYTVRNLYICAILRDWQRAQVGQRSNYPEKPVTMVRLGKWDRADAIKYLRERVAAHQIAEREYHERDEHEEGLPHCSDEERWLRGGDWAVFRHTKEDKPQKRAAKTADSHEEAESWAAENVKEGVNYSIVERPGKPARCDGDFCNVSQWCTQYRKYKEDNKEHYQEPVDGDGAKAGGEETRAA